MKILVYDYGLCTEHAIRLARDGHMVFYYVPWQDAFPQSTKALIGEGLEGLHRIKDFWDYIDKVDIIVFFDNYCGDLVDYLRKKGYKVFGAGSAEKLELDRIKQKEILKTVGLPVGEYEVIHGLSALREYLKENEDKYVKINAFRGDVECVDEKTEILTEQGWKFFRDLNPKKDKVLSLDLKTRKAKFVPINHFYESYYKGKMYEIKGRSIDLLVTPKHKFFVKSHSALKDWKYLPIEKFKNLYSFRIPISFEMEGKEPTYFIIPALKSTTRNYKEKKIKIKDWIEFLGWFLSEGSLNLAGKKKNKYRITISQSKRKHYKKWKKIKNLLKRLKFNYQIEGNNGFSIYNKALYIHLANTCYEGKILKGIFKKIPNYIFKLSPRLKRIFLDTFLEGDGCKEKKYNRYYTTSSFLADGLQILILMIGKNSSISQRKRKKEWNICYQISEKKTKDIFLKKKAIKETEYEGYIYDVNVEPYHSILIRRNGKVCWTGNTFHHKDYKSSLPLLDHIAYKLGAKQEELDFIVEDTIPGVEPGYDGFVVDGKYPEITMYGYELKGAGYIGRIVLDKGLPPALKEINTKLAPFFKVTKARTMFSTEVRVGEDRKGYLIDPCVRAPMPVPSAIEIEIYKNFSDIIINAAQGKLIKPQPIAKYGVGVSLESEWAQDHWLEVTIPEEIRQWVKLRMAVKFKDKYYAIPGFISICSVIGLGNTIDEAAEKCKKRVEMVDAYMIDKDTSGIDKIKEIIEEGKHYGIPF